MSRSSLALIIAITLGLPVVAIVVIAQIGGVHTDLLRAFLSGGVVFAFVTAAIFEVRRLAGLDGALPAGAAAGHGADAPVAAERVAMPAEAALPEVREPIVVAAAAQPVVIEAPVEITTADALASAAAAEPIVVDAPAAAEAPVKRPRRKAAAPAESAVAARETERKKPAGRSRKAAPKA